jgi:catalase
VLEDFIRREKITHFDHERIPERIVHAHGSGAHGFFEVTQSLTQYTKADFLQVLAIRRRFLSAPRPLPVVPVPATWHGTCAGVATKFYTRQGNFDLVGKQYRGVLHSGRHEVS